MNKTELIRRLQEEIMEERKDLPCGSQRDIVVYVNHGLDEYDILLIQEIESAIDKALVPLGYTRSTSSKDGHICESVYWQFAKSL